MHSVDTSSFDLTVIIPIRVGSDRSDAIDRIRFVAHDDRRPGNVGIMIVDDGSEPQAAQDLCAVCEELGYAYHRIESSSSTFSAGRARNIGAQLARTRYLMFQDADLMPYPGFYQEVQNEMLIQGLHRFSERFVMFGVIYLSQEATQEYMATPVALRRSQFIQYFLEADTSRVVKFSTGTSVTAWSRSYYLSAGGMDPDFEGWGYEDLEFICRAIRREKLFPLPEDFAVDYRNFQQINEYRGWKSIYRLYGDITFQKGMVMFHAWHPVADNGNYVEAKERNRQLFIEKQRMFASVQEEPDPLPMPECGRTLIFRTHPWVYNRWVAPYFGEITYVDENRFTVESFARFVKDRAIDRILFHNPYATDKMLELYNWARASGVPFIVCERGALPGSVFFDPRGFNGESSSYDPAHWRRTLTSEQNAAVNAYLQEVRSGSDNLEEQPDRIGVRALRKRLKLAPGTKVLFVPLQRPSDTVIKYLVGDIGSYDNFLNLIRRLTEILPPDWTIVAKRHPLETVRPDLPAVQFADQAHVNDLLELCDSVLLINSGVGLTGLAFNKPVLYAGRAFYGHEGLATQVRTVDDVMTALNTFKPDAQALRQFFHYLVFEFYSFAKFKTRRVPWVDGSMMTATQRIDYKVIRIPGQEELRLERRPRSAISHDSVLFDRYRGTDGKVVPERVALSKPAAVPKTAPAPAPARANKPAAAVAAGPVDARPVDARPVSAPTRSAVAVKPDSVSAAAIVSPMTSNVTVSSVRSPAGTSAPAASSSQEPVNHSSAGEALPMNPSVGKSSGAASGPVVLKKLKKLRNDPITFLRDSRYGVFRTIGRSVSKH